ncbi:MAG: SNF2 helicase associated domain-containing protein [Ruminococcus sp.]|nr:SNF2 helicase associated domain-containing protein [Ruminococcus sp.]
MNFNNFQDYIDSKILKSGEELYSEGNIVGVRENGNTISALICSENIANITTLTYEKSGNIKKYSCSCLHLKAPSRLCKHIVALILYTRDNYFPQIPITSEKSIISNGSSRKTKVLITEFRKLAEELVLNSDAETKARIVPELYTKYGNELNYSLKIGRERLYTVSNVIELMNRFLYGEKYSYGKCFEFTHDFNSIDERSYRLLNLSVSIVNSETGYYSDGKIFAITKYSADSFFELFKDDYVTYNGTPYLVKYANPEITLKIRKVKNSRYSLKIETNSILVCIGRRGCFINNELHTFYMADADFSKNIYKLYLAFGSDDVLYIAEDDMKIFYNSVLKPLSKYIAISGMDRLEEYLPPEMICRLYIDTADDSTVSAKAEYSYDSEIFPIFYDRHKNLFCDYEGENIAEKSILKYFSKNDDDSLYPLTVKKENDIYRLMNEGIPELSKIMEIYTTDSFNKISVRPPARTVVGIRPGSGNLLELDITAEGYTIDELISLLGAYRKGKKYHRLKDGSFASVDNSIGELAEITESLNITDKALLKEKISIPKYRMLYLDNLKHDCEAVRIDRSREFKKMLKEYKTSVEDTENISVPDVLDETMRDYQKYGYRWLKVIANYGFGGILADDMGLGKTIQAIALMLEYKNSNSKHKPCLVVCPSSLMLNWENEIRKFAPELKSLIISGTASARSELLNNIMEYDVIITSYSLIIRDIAEYEQIKFYYEFIDEAQYIKNHTTQMSKAVKGINADIKFALTGTPVENSLAELWSIFDFIMQGYLFSYNYFKKNYESPIVLKKDEKQVKALQKIVSPFILRRLKKDVLNELPDKTETVLRAEMNDEQSKVYSANVAEMKLLLSQKFDSQADRFRILSMITKLRQICCDPALVYENFSGGSAKLEQCLELVSDCVQGGHKILIFSQFTSMLDIISKKLTENEISYYMLTGKTSPKTRMKLVNSFNEDDTKVFLISLKAGGTGLNLTGADIVIHYDPWWNVSAENQASDRAYRIGQKHNVQIYKLIAVNSIEEKIIKIQEDKSELFDIAVTGDSDIMHMNAGDILKLLE